MPKRSELRRVTTSKLDRAAEIFELLGNKSRLAMIMLMLEKERPVAEIASRVGISSSMCSQFLARLRAAEIVEFRKEANIVYYRCVSPEAIRVIRVLRDLKLLPSEDQEERA